MLKIANINYKMAIYIFILFLLLVPWLNTSIDFKQNAGIASQEDVTFYEINPCKVSLFEFLRSNPKSIYQNHFHFRFNNYSSISCFGRVSGLTVIDSDFFISIGTNTFINIIFQGLICLLFLKFITRNKLSISENKVSNLAKNISILLTTYLFYFSVFSEKRFYEKQLYYVDFDEAFYKALVFLLFYFIIYNLIDIAENRSDNILNFLPFLFIFHSVISGTNITLFSSIFIYFGIISIIRKESLKKFNKIMVSLSVIWILNSTESYYFEPGKFRGFTSSIYEFNSSIYWCIYFILLINGIWYLFKTKSNKFKFDKFINNASLTSIVLVILGYLGANLPLINFFNYYYFGQQKFGISRNNPFEFNSWAEKLSWRGFYTSAETIGEFYGLCIILILYSYSRKKTINKIETIGFVASFLGIYFSNNRTSMLLAFLFSVYLLIEHKSYKRNATLLLSFFGMILLTYLVGVDDLTYELDFITTRITANTNSYSFEGINSSFSRWLNTNYGSGGFLSGIFGFFSFMGYFLNRSQRWGIFFARYNPTYMESILGSGPLSLGQVYGETPIAKTETFLLPHSSLLSFLVYFGFLGVLVLFLLLIFKFLDNRKSITTLGKMIILFIFINFLKNDLVNYFAPFTLYLVFMIGILNYNNNLFFKISSSSNYKNTGNETKENKN